MLAHKAFWVYYLRLFQNFEGDRVAACCDFFGVTRAALETAILRDLYQIHRAEDEEIAFQPYGPGEQFHLVRARIPYCWPTGQV